MLSLLHIENIAVIDQADITFGRGFNVLTGETGAGKSIVIDAISAILGERTYRDVIRTGTQKAFVSAIFTDMPELSWFGDYHVPYAPETMIQREIFLDGKNVCRVNGQAVTVSALRQLGLQLINIHGQHDSQALFDEANHLGYLDAFGRDQALLDAYGEKYAAVAALNREIDRLSMDESEKLRRMEALKFQIDEISRANLKPGEDETLEARRKLLQNAEKLSDGMALSLAPYGITVNNIAPGAIQTPRNEAVLSDSESAKAVNAKIPLGYAGKPSDIAPAVLLLCSDEGRYITGSEIIIDGGMHL